MRSGRNAMRNNRSQAFNLFFGNGGSPHRAAYELHYTRCPKNPNSRISSFRYTHKEILGEHGHFYPLAAVAPAALFSMQRKKAVNTFLSKFGIHFLLVTRSGLDGKPELRHLRHRATRKHFAVTARDASR